MSASPAVLQPPGMLSDNGWSPAAARDRLSSTLFLAGLLHGVVILGVTFTAERAARDPVTTSLDVVIVTRDYEQQPQPLNSAALLAQQNLIGRGNAPLDARLRTAVTASLELVVPGPDQDGVLRKAGPTGDPLRAESWLTAVARRVATVRPGRPGVGPVPLVQRQQLGPDAEATDILTEPDLYNAIPDANPRELLVSAATRETRIASYLNTWKSKVERIGTLNIADIAALATIRSYPVVEVAIGSDGTLREVTVRRSSGYRNLDQAATEILRIAAPFEPFPQGLRKDYDVLRFAYEWRFGSTNSVSRVKAGSGS